MKNTKIFLAGDMFPMPCNYALFAAGDTQALFGQKLCDLFALSSSWGSTGWDGAKMLPR